MSLNYTEKNTLRMKPIIRKPFIDITSTSISSWEGWEKVNNEISDAISSLGKTKTLIAIECYPGTFEDFNLRNLKYGLQPEAVCLTKDILKDENMLEKYIEELIIQKDRKEEINRVSKIDKFIDENKFIAINKNLAQLEKGVIIIFGIGASVLFNYDILVYADMSHNEAQYQFRQN